MLFSCCKSTDAIVETNRDTPTPNLEQAPKPTPPVIEVEKPIVEESSVDNGNVTDKTDTMEEEEPTPLKILEPEEESVSPPPQVEEASVEEEESTNEIASIKDAAVERAAVDKSYKCCSVF